MSVTQTPCQKINQALTRHRQHFRSLQALQVQISANPEHKSLRREITLLQKKLSLTHTNVYQTLDAALSEKRMSILNSYPEGEEITRFREGRAWLRENTGRTYLLDTQAKKIPGLVLTRSDSVVRNFEHHRAIIARGQEQYLLDSQGRFLHAKGFMDIQPDYPVYRVRLESAEVGLLNTAGERITSEWYGAIKPFRRGKALALTSDKKFVFLDETGRELWQRFDGAKEFANGKALVAVGTKRFYIDEEGERIT